MTPRRSRGRRLVLAAAAAVVVVLAGCSEIKNNGQNSLQPKGPQAAEDRQPLHPDPDPRDHRRHRDHHRHRRRWRSSSATARARTRTRSRSTATPRSRSAGRSSPRCCSRSSRCPRSPPSSTWPQNPGPTRSQVTVEGKQWWWQFYVPGDGGKVVTADELHIPTGRDVFVTLNACDGTGAATTCNVIHSFWVPELDGQEGRRARARTNTLTLSADKPGTYLGQCAEYCGLSHANMRFRVIAKTAGRLRAVARRAAAGTGDPLYESDGTTPAGRPRRSSPRRSSARTATSSTTRSKATYGPNLTHLASRTTFASGYVPAEPPEPRSNWVRDAPSMIPMSSQDCRLPPGQGICVGMPSFTKNTPHGHARR